MRTTTTQRPRRSLRSRPTFWVITLIALIAATPMFAAQFTHAAALAAPLEQTPGASVRTKVQVPASMRAAPFDVDRYLNVPPNFGISVFARVGNARFMAFAPNGDLFVSQPGSGKILAIRPTSGDPQIFAYASGLRNPHDIVFHTIGGTTYVYIAESHQINRYVYRSGDTAAFGRQVIISGLPDNSTPELQGKYGHQLKNIALDGNDQLYVSIASTCNACVEDTVSNPKRGAIYVYNADGTNRRLFAEGLRNAEGLAMVPGTNTLWVVVNNRDNLGYPFHNDFDGDGSDDYGKVLPGYVDNHPPEPFTSVRQGGNYGWPFCNSNPDNGLNNMPFDRDVQLNADGSRLNCDTADRVSKGIQAHSAPLGLTFLQNTAFPSAYRNGAVVGYHGSWNRTQRTGYKVAYFPWNSTTQAPGDPIDLVTGWIEGTNVWGRPVDMAVDTQGNMFISDDGSGTIYKLTYTPTALSTPSPTPSPTPSTSPSPSPSPTASPSPSPAILPNGTYTLTSKASGKRLDVANASTMDGANVWQWTPNNTCAQRWALENVNNGYYRLTNACGNKVLDVAGVSGAEGADVVQWAWVGGDNQQWKIDPNGDGTYTLTARHSGKVLDVKYSGTGDGVDVWQWTPNGTNAQRWTITAAP